MDLDYLSQVDNVALRLELAKRVLESAKNDFEIAKQAYEEMLAQSDSHGISRAKLKKLTDDRVLALIENGLISGMESGATSTVETKRERARKVSKKLNLETPDGDEDRSAGVLLTSDDSSQRTISIEGNV